MDEARGALAGWSQVREACRWVGEGRVMIELRDVTKVYRSGRREVPSLRGVWYRNAFGHGGQAETLEEWLERCHAAGQARPTPLILRYRAGDYNCLHRDLYGDLVFPIQAAILLSTPGRDFEGGEFMLVEQRPRLQSRGEVVPLGQGDAVLFAVNERPNRGTRGWHRTTLKPT